MYEEAQEEGEPPVLDIINRGEEMVEEEEEKQATDQDQVAVNNTLDNSVIPPPQDLMPTEQHDNIAMSV